MLLALVYRKHWHQASPIRSSIFTVSRCIEERTINGFSLLASCFGVLGLLCINPPPISRIDE
jgi:hypothetical protein